MMRGIWLNVPQDRGQLRLLEPTNTTITEAETYYKISGTMSDGCAHNFVVSNNKLIWKGNDNNCFMFSGVSDVKADKACMITYSLFKNGEPVVGAQTPHDFPASAKTSTISIVAICVLDRDDELEIYVKSDTANVVISVHSLNIVLWGEK